MVNFQAVILVDQLDTMISSKRERAFLEALLWQKDNQ
jgi:hypothetical protein